MKTFIALVVGIAVGVGAGYVALERPWESATESPKAMDDEDVADELVRQLRADGNRDVDSASCGQRQASAGRQYTCSISGAGGNDSILGLFDYLVTVHGDRIEYRRRLSG